MILNPDDLSIRRRGSYGSCNVILTGGRLTDMPGMVHYRFIATCEVGTDSTVNEASVNLFDEDLVSHNMSKIGQDSTHVYFQCDLMQVDPTTMPTPGPAIPVRSWRAEATFMVIQTKDSTSVSA